MWIISTYKAMNCKLQFIYSILYSDLQSNVVRILSISNTKPWYCHDNFLFQALWITHACPLNPENIKEEFAWRVGNRKRRDGFYVKTILVNSYIIQRIWDYLWMKPITVEIFGFSENWKKIQFWTRCIFHAKRIKNHFSGRRQLSSFIGVGCEENS